MSTVYKVTTRSMCTIGRYKWRLGEKRKIAMPMFRQRPILCTRTVLHAFINPLQMLMFDIDNNLREEYPRPRLFLGKGTVVVQRYDKVGLKALTLVRELCWPRVTRKQLVALVEALVAKFGKLGGPIYWSNTIKGATTTELWDMTHTVFERTRRYKQRAVMYKIYNKICGLPKIKERANAR